MESIGATMPRLTGRQSIDAVMRRGAHLHLSIIARPSATGGSPPSTTRHPTGLRFLMFLRMIGRDCCTHHECHFSNCGLCLGACVPFHPGSGSGGRRVYVTGDGKEGEEAGRLETIRVDSQ